MFKNTTCFVLHYQPSLLEFISYRWWFRNLTPVEVGSLSHYAQGFLHPRWLFEILSINSIKSLQHMSTRIVESTRHPLRIHWSRRQTWAKNKPGDVCTKIIACQKAHSSDIVCMTIFHNILQNVDQQQQQQQQTQYLAFWSPRRQLLGQILHFHLNTRGSFIRFHGGYS